MQIQPMMFGQRRTVLGDSYYGGSNRYLEPATGRLRLTEEGAQYQVVVPVLLVEGHILKRHTDNFYPE